MEEELHHEAVDDAANTMLNGLLLRLEGVIGDVRGTTDGMPHFLVEARLREALQTRLPAITFTPGDISAWALGFSS
ncbi:hypothetical protein [Arthrobacter sp. OV608]|uniref:hypothetical protein n=1 Tax=Arthrobacter sp. OV608 TaxID=1882768 RepID=UPI0008C967A5|nr:hypothetical protein [Arthrobacter sp. OV608]SEP85340.1 hypothetical protein SAMN05444745_102210 [Arthrobacter sp. OV608]